MYQLKLGNFIIIIHNEILLIIYFNFNVFYDNFIFIFQSFKRAPIISLCVKKLEQNKNEFIN